MLNPETNSPIGQEDPEVPEVPDGAIFLPDIPLTPSGIKRRYFELLADRGDCRGLSAQDKLFLEDEMKNVQRLLGMNALSQPS